MLDIVSAACSTSKCKEAGELGNNNKRSLPEDSAKNPAKKVAKWVSSQGLLLVGEVGK